MNDMKKIFRMIAIAGALLCFAGTAAPAQDAGKGLRLLTRDAVLVSQAIGWSLAAPLQPAEAAPVSFAPGVQPRPGPYGRLVTDKVMLLDYDTPPGAAYQRRLVGVIELSDELDHHFLSRFDTTYEVAPSGTYFVSAVAVHEMTPVTPRVEAYVVPATLFGPRGLTGMTPYAMVEAIRKNAVDPNTRDDAPRNYQVYVVGMDRLPEAAGIGFTAIDGTTGREIGRSQNIRSNGWVVAGMPLTFAMNGTYGVYFPIVYRPDDAKDEERILMVFSNRTAAPGKPVATGGPQAAPPPSDLGRRFLAKSFAGLSAQR